MCEEEMDCGRGTHTDIVTLYASLWAARDDNGGVMQLVPIVRDYNYTHSLILSI